MSPIERELNTDCGAKFGNSCWATTVGKIPMLSARNYTRLRWMITTG